MARRDEVLAAAVELLDEVGLDALTTRRLAAKLGVQAGALYRHYPSKQALLDAVVGHLIAEPSTRVPVTDGSWDDVLRSVASSTRATMLAHRDGARLIASFRIPSSQGEVVFQRLVGMLVTAGAGEETALCGVDTLFAYVNGFTVEEQARGGGRDAGFRAGLELIIAGIRAGLPDAGAPSGTTRPG